MTQNIFLNSAKYIAVELVGELFYFPLWWYSRGTKKSFVFFWQKVVSMERRVGLAVWLTNLFRPMYNQNDWQGLVISFFMRLAQIIFRSIWLAVWLVLMMMLFLFWLALPPLIIYQLISFFR